AWRPTPTKVGTPCNGPGNAVCNPMYCTNGKCTVDLSKAETRENVCVADGYTIGSNACKYTKCGTDDSNPSYGVCKVLNRVGRRNTGRFRQTSCQQEECQNGVCSNYTRISQIGKQCTGLPSQDCRITVCSDQGVCEYRQASTGAACGASNPDPPPACRA